MSDLINTVLNGDLYEILGDELYKPVVAAVAATWSILAFGGAVQVFSNLFAALYNFRTGRKL